MLEVKTLSGTADPGIIPLTYAHSRDTIGSFDSSHKRVASSVLSVR